MHLLAQTVAGNGRLDGSKLSRRIADGGWLTHRQASLGCVGAKCGIRVTHHTASIRGWGGTHGAVEANRAIGDCEALRLSCKGLVEP